MHALCATVGPKVLFGCMQFLIVFFLYSLLCIFIEFVINWRRIYICYFVKCTVYTINYTNSVGVFVRFICMFVSIFKSVVFTHLDTNYCHVYQYYLFGCSPSFANTTNQETTVIQVRSLARYKTG